MFDEWLKNINAANGTDSGNIYQNYARAGVMKAAPAATAGGEAVVKANIEETTRKDNAAAADAKAKLDAKVEADKVDPGKAKMVMRDDRSGYDFFNGAGEKLNINAFSLLTGKRPDELLADSDNPRDQKFVSDYNTMRTLSNAWVNGDTDTLAKYRQADPKKFNELISQYKNPQDMVKGFMGFYSDYYGQTNNNNPADAPRFSPGDPRAGEDVYGPDRSVSLMDPNNSKLSLGATNLQQVTTPVGDPRPDEGNWWDRNNPFSGRKDALKRWDDSHKQDPWAQYYNSLLGR